MTKITTPDDIEKLVEHGYADNNGVKIHYASLGAGPLIVMIHGFPDFWYTWRQQMLALSDTYQTVAIDLRGYNLSDKPAGGENYAMRYLLGDIAAVIQHIGQKQAIIVGHDWGGAISWQLAMRIPTLVSRLIILNLPHPRGMRWAMTHNPQQRTNSQYARDFLQEGAHLQLTPEKLSEWVKDPEARSRYREAFQRSDFEAMLHYYKQNYPREPYQEDSEPVIKVQAPVLQIHGLEDQALLADGLNNTWNWVQQTYTLVTIPHAGHFVQQDASDLVTQTIRNWMAE
ncbi:MAG TPA: alpha/beta hydrolase [Ktedonobacteraceae bacterium]|nr:alpha/beta hydrolase [Ktedonobacteraceae bacterium]